MRKRFRSSAVETRTVGANPQAVTVGDFNGDGLQDLAVANTGSDTVSVLLGRGDGTSQPPVTVSVGTSPQSIAVGFFNGDAVQDLAVADNGSHTVSVLIGVGNGTFQAAVTLAAGVNPTSVAVGNFNGDGSQDIAVANAGSHTVGILSGNGNGTFQPAQVFAAGTNPASVAVGSFNGDGAQDLAVANSGSNTVSVLLGNGNGSFQAASTFSAGNGARSIAAGDVSGDGHQDLAVANFGSDNVTILLGNGSGGFTPAGSFAASGAYAVAIGNLNGDAIMDVTVTNGRSTAVFVLLATGGGAFSAAAAFGTGSNPSSVAIADFNGDGKQDVTVSNAGAGSASVLLGNGNGTLHSPPSFAAGGGPVYVAVGDFNADQVRDLAVANYDANTLSVLLGTGNGNFSAPQAYATGAVPWAVAVGDFNADGNPDLTVANAGASHVSVFLGVGNGTFTPAVSLTVGTNPQGVTVGDVNADGKHDIVAANVNGSSISVLLGNGNGTFQAAAHFAAGSGPVTVALADFNGDNKPDAVVGNYYTTTVSILLGNGNGTFQAPQSFTGGPGPLMVATGDFNGDGAVDLTVANYQQQAFSTIAVLMGNGTGTLGTAQFYPIGIGPSAVAVADVDADGKQDIAVPNYGSNTVPALFVSVLKGNGNGTFQTPVNFGGGSGTIFVAFDDFNTDNKPDMVAANYGANSVTVLLNNTVTAQVATPSFNPAGGTYALSVVVALSTTTSGATIHYTTDGSTPTTASAVYSVPITLTQSATIRAIAAKAGMLTSAEASASYTVQQPAATPTFNPAGGTYAGSVGVSISTTTSGATIYYTTDGSAPTTASPVYGGPFTLTQSATVRAIATAPGMLTSAEASASYTVQHPAATPTFTPPGGTYAGAVVVTIGTTTSGATIYYTTDGSAPTTASPVYGGPFTLTQSATVRAIATAPGSLTSAEASATYTLLLTVETPTFNPPAGTYVESVAVAISTTTAGATIHYTTNGTTPTTASPVYSGAITLSQTTTVRAIAVKAGMAASAEASATYTLQVAAPTFNPPGGTYSQPQSVTLSTTTSGATIHYTLDGSTPTTASAVYSSPIGVPFSKTIRAIAVKSGMLNSTVASATYTLQAAAPTFNPPGGNYTVLQLVSLSSASPGATIYYTTNGSTPTTSSTPYTLPIAVLTTTTIRAIAVVPGWTQSSVASATYTFLLF